MLEKFGGEAFVGSILLGQLEGDVHHVNAEERHPSGAVGLFENGAVGKLFAAIDHGDVVQSKEAALEDIVALAIHLVHPPGEVDQQFVETFFEEFAVGVAGAVALDLVNPPDRPGMHRRIEIRELPFVGGDLAVDVLKLLEQEKPKIIRGEAGIDERHGGALKRQVPSGKPRILPLVGHGENAHGVEMPPMQIAAVPARIRRRALGVVAFEPQVHIEVEHLLAPEQAGEGLPLDHAFFFGGAGGMDGVVEHIGFAFAIGDDVVDVAQRIGERRPE